MRECAAGGEVVLHVGGEMKWSEEVLLLVKTTEGRYLELQSRIRELHSYDVPEIVAVPIEIGLDEYLEWVAQSV